MPVTPIELYQGPVPCDRVNDLLIEAADDIIVDEASRLHRECLCPSLRRDPRGLRQLCGTLLHQVIDHGVVLPLAHQLREVLLLQVLAYLTLLHLSLHV